MVEQGATAGTATGERGGAHGEGAGSAGVGSPAEVRGHGGLLAAAALRALGIDTLFTLSGGHLFSLYDGCVQRGLRLVDVRHEQTATFATLMF